MHTLSSLLAPYRSGRTPRFIVALCIAAAVAPAALAQPCTPQFAPGFESPGVQGYIKTSISYDAQDGTGPHLIVAGSFSRAGGKLCNGIAMFDGTNFTPLGGGLPSNSLPTSGSGLINTMAVFDPDGDGPLPPELWVGGSFSRARQSDGSLIAVNGLARWSGTTRTWSQVQFFGGVFQVYDLLVDNQTTGPDQGPRIYVANSRSTSNSRYLTAFVYNGVDYNAIPIGGGSAGTLTNIVKCLGKFNGQVYLGGAFPQGVQRISADGTQRELLPANPAMIDTTFVASMATFQNRLFIGGYNTAQIESFNGTAWNPEALGALDGPTSSPCDTMKVIDMGTGPKLYLGDSYYGFNSGAALGTAFVGAAVWDGTTLAPFASGVYPEINRVSAFTPVTLRGQNVLFLGGSFSGGLNTDGSRVGGRAGVFYNGTSFVSQYPSPVQGLSSPDSIVKLDGVNDRLVTQGQSILSDAANPNGIAQFDGTSWSGSTIPVYSTNLSKYVRYNDGTGDALYAYAADAASGLHAAKWNGAAWIDLPPCPFANTGLLFDSAVIDLDGSGPLNSWLILAGNTVGDDTIPVPHSVLGWDGTAWRNLGDGIPDTLSDNASIRSLAVYDNGSGPKLYAAGAFLINDQPWGVARYDGTSSGGTWTGIGHIDSFYVNKLRVLNLGAGSKLYAAGFFNDIDNGVNVNSTPIAKLAQWTGSTWTGLNTGTVTGVPFSPLVSNINDIAAFDDGSGTALFACGSFSAINGVPVTGVAKYNGVNWSSLGQGLGVNSYNDSPRLNPSTLLVFDQDGPGPSLPALYISGAFDNADGLYTQGFARYNACPAAPPACLADIASDSSDTTRNPNGSVGPEDLEAFVNGFIAENTAIADVASDSSDITYNPNGSVGPEDLEAFVNAFIAGC